MPTVPRVCAAALVSALTLIPPCFADEETARLLAQIQGAPWPFASGNLAGGSSWVMVEFHDEASLPGEPPTRLYAYQNTSSNVLLLRHIAGEGSGNFTGRLSVYYAEQLEQRGDTNPGWARIRRRDKPGMLLKGTFNSRWPGREAPRSVTRPEKADYLPYSPLTGWLHDAKIDADKIIRPACRDMTYRTDILDKTTGGPKGWPDVFYADQRPYNDWEKRIDILFTRLEHQLMVAMAKDENVSILMTIPNYDWYWERARSKNLADDALPGFASAVREEVDPWTKSFSEKLRNNPEPAEHFLPAESRLILCHLRFLGEKYEKALFEEIQRLNKPEATPEERKGLVSCLRPLAQVLADSVLVEASKPNRTPQTVENHEKEDKLLRENGMAYLDPFLAARNWSRCASIPQEQSKPKAKSKRD